MKKKRKITIFILIIVLILVGVFSFLQRSIFSIAIKNETITKQQWHEDIEYLRKNLPKKHKNLYFKISEQEFNNSIDNLEKDLDSIDSKEIQVRLMSIIASVGDAHTDILNFKSNSKYPLDLYWFKEGLFVIGSDSKYENILGGRVTEINGIPIKKIEEGVNTLIPHENEYWLKFRNTSMLLEPKALKHFGVINKDSVNENISLTVEKSDNTISKKEVIAEKERDIKWSYLIDKAKEKPLYLRTNKDSSIIYDEKDKLIYFKFDDSFMHPTKKELSLLKDMLKENKADKLIIDIRNNMGGIHLDKSKLVDMIIDSPDYNKKEKLFVIVGRETFSSGLLYAAEFKNRTNATFCGEPTGGSLRHYGDVRNFKLPNSKLEIRYSTKYFDKGPGDSLVPECKVDYSIKDYVEGIDPVIEKIKAEYK